MKITFVVTAFIAITIAPAAHAEYCEDQLNKDISAVSAESGEILNWKSENQARAISLTATKKELDQKLAAASADTTLTDAQKLAIMKLVAAGQAAAQADLDNIAAQNAQKNGRLNDLKGSVPEALKQKAQECAKQLAPANLLVNLVVQGLALYYTGGASAILPEKALYVDMGEVLNGNIMGGEHSVPNDVKNWINGRLGLHL